MKKYDELCNEGNKLIDHCKYDDAIKKFSVPASKDYLPAVLGIACCYEYKKNLCALRKIDCVSQMKYYKHKNNQYLYEEAQHLYKENQYKILCWYKKAAALGYIFAHTIVGLIYFDMNETSEAEKHLNIAAEDEDKIAKIVLKEHEESKK